MIDPLPAAPKSDADTRPAALAGRVEREAGTDAPGIVEAVFDARKFSGGVSRPALLSFDG